MQDKLNKFFFVICFLNILFLFAVLLDVLLPVGRSLQALLIILLNCTYIALYKTNKSTAKLTRRFTPFSLCFIIYICLLIVQIFVSIFADSSTVYLALSLILIAVTFWKILDITYAKNVSIEYVLRPYMYISEYVMVASVVVFVALLFGIISLSSYIIDPTKYELFNGNFQIGGARIFNPLRLIYILDSDRGVKFFGQFGTFLGICHEPHISTYLISPALFMILAFCRKKLLWLLLFLATVLLSSSVTNLILSALCLIAYFWMEYRYLPNIARVSAYSLLIITIFFIATNYSYVSESIGLEIISTKLQTSNMSYDYSANVLSYMYNPESFLGSGILVYCYNPNATDIGYFTFLLNLIFQSSFIVGIISICSKGNRQSRIIGLGLVYFALHTLKIGQMIYQFPYLIFMLYIGHILFITQTKKI